MTFDYVIPFGKYKGHTIEEVFNYDASYLKWAIENTGRLILSEENVRTIEDKAEEEHKNWLNDNNDDDPFDDWYGNECDQYGYYGN
jgi:hypothetical protein